MNTGRILLLSVLLILAGCRKEPMPPEDSRPFPMDANKDLTVAPGDDFFRYCNGNWLRNATIPKGKMIYGGLFVAVNLAKDRMNALYEQDPLLSRVMSDANAMFSGKEASRAYINQLLESIPDPASTSTDEYIRLIGQLTRMGVEGLLFVYPSVDDNTVKVSIIPECFQGIEDSKGDPNPSPNGERSKHFMALLAQGMGIDPATIKLSEAEIEDDVYAGCLDVAPEVLANTIKKNIRQMRRFTDESKNLSKLVDEVVDRIFYYANYRFVQEYAPAGLKETYTEVCERLRAQFSKRIDALDWMSETTKALAQEKLQAMEAHVAYPDHWFQETFPTLEEIAACGSFAEEYMKLVSSDLDFTLALGGKDAEEYRMETYVALGNKISDVGASYDTKINALFINTSILLPPVIPEGITEARAYAAFAVAGHEMTHGFDLDGANYDKDGEKKNWWTVADKMAFEDRMQMLVECYNHLEIAPDIMPGTYCNGTVTLEENLADLGGVNIALDAYTEYLQEQGYFGSVLQEQQRKFFESYADLWCCLYEKKYIDNRTTGERPDKHALPRERVNGVVMNIDLWYELYGVDRNNMLYLPPERRTKIW